MNSENTGESPDPGTVSSMAAVTRKKQKISTKEESNWSSSTKTVVSILISLHLLAVFAAPWGSPEPSSDLAKSVAGIFSPYLQFMSLDNGYRYFAPDPGPSHLVRYELIRDEKIIKSGEFPSRDSHWPRLLYHRHFMLSEMMYQLASAVPEVPPGVLPEDVLTKNERQQVVLFEERSQSLQRSIADHLLATNPDATSVRLQGITHAIPSQFDVQRGMSLDDERLYQTVPLGEFKRSDRRE